MEKITIPIAEKGELQPNEYRIRTVLGRKIAVIALKHGYHGVECNCKHQNACLLTKERGVLDSMVVSCPHHGWQYDLKTGECLTNDSVPLRIYEIIEKDDKIMLSVENE